MMKMIQIDKQEGNNLRHDGKSIRSEFKRQKIPFEIHNLVHEGVKFGDITNSERTFVIERKWKDFWNLGHTESQMQQLAQFEGEKYLMIEGTISEWASLPFKDQYINPRILNGGWALVGRAAKLYGISVVWCDTLKEMVKYIYWIDREKKRSNGPLILNKKREINPHLTLMCSIEGIGPSTGQKLLNKFGVPLNVFIAPDEEILSISGVGKVTLENIRRHVE